MFKRLTLPVLILLLASGLRFHALGQDSRFHPDEALYALFARNAALKGDWLLSGELDKPPLTIYAQAVSMHFFAAQQNEAQLLDFDVHQGEFAARIPSTFAMMIVVALVYAIGKKIITSVGARHVVSLQYAAIYSMLIMALSPFAIAFSATAFTDGLLLLWLTLALWLALRGSWVGCGVCLALAFASKQQGLLYLPLALMIIWVQNGLVWRKIVSLILPLSVGVVLLLLWDEVRDQPHGIWTLATAHYPVERWLIRPDEIIPRLRIWLGYGHWFIGPGWLAALVIALGAAGYVVIWRKFKGYVGTRRAVSLPAIDTKPNQVSNRTPLQMMTVYAAAFILLHWIAAFFTYDRYLLPLLPLFAVLLGGGLAAFSDGIVMIWRVGSHRAMSLQMSIIILLGVALLPGALAASEGRIPVGDDRGEHAGIDTLAVYLNIKPLGTIVYDRWLGWELGYYLGQWTDKRKVYYPTPEILAADALLQPDPAPRYFVAPTTQDVTAWLVALRDAGFVVMLDYDDGRFAAWQIIPPKTDG